MTHGQPFVGTDVGPMLLRKAGLLQKLTSLGWRVEDQGDLDFNKTTTSTTPGNSSSRSSRGSSSSSSSSLISQTTTTKTTTTMPPSWNAKNAAIVGRGGEQLCDLVATKMQQGRFPLILGGDHSIAIGSLAGILQTQPDTGILWIDAHADINTPDISESGNMHGMPVSCFVIVVAVVVAGLLAFSYVS
jgi:arginase